MEAHRHTTTTFTTFEKIEAALRPSMIPNLCIKFNFFIKHMSSFWINNQDVHPTPYFVRDGASTRHHVTTTVAVRGESVSHDAIQEAIEGAVGDLLTARNRRDLITIACDKVAERLPAGAALPRYSVLGLDFKVSVEFLHVFEVYNHGMIPAAESSLAMLEEQVGEGCCCICLEEFGGGGELKMPCSHVFHGGCIKKWLRSSHYCPVCRYEMPTN